MSTTETYSESHRDRVETQLAAERDKVDLLERHSNGIHVIAYRAMKECVNTIWIHDEGTNTSCEYQVGDHEILEWFYHACAHREANMPIYLEEFGQKGRDAA